MTEHDAQPPRPELVAIHEEALRLGFLHGTDYAIDGIPAPLSSEHIVLSVVDGQYEVLYRDMGRNRLLLRTPDVAQARTTFLEETAWLAAGRDHGPYAGRRRPEAEPDPRSVEEITAEFLAQHGRRADRDPGER